MLKPKYTKCQVYQNVRFFILKWFQKYLPSLFINSSLTWKRWKPCPGQPIISVLLSIIIYIIPQVILAFWLVLAYDLLMDRSASSLQGFSFCVLKFVLYNKETNYKSSFISKSFSITRKPAFAHVGEHERKSICLLWSSNFILSLLAQSLR